MLMWQLLADRSAARTASRMAQALARVTHVVHRACRALHTAAGGAPLDDLGKVFGVSKCASLIASLGHRSGLEAVPCQLLPLLLALFRLVCASHGCFKGAQFIAAMLELLLADGGSKEPVAACPAVTFSSTFHPNLPLHDSRHHDDHDSLQSCLSIPFELWFPSVAHVKAYKSTSRLWSPLKNLTTSGCNGPTQPCQASEPTQATAGLARCS
jgi:hypothetical protein